MATAQFKPVVRYFRRVLAAQADHLSDSDLLDRFSSGHDEEAFAHLVQRHGKLVLGTCRRVVHDSHAAEDCYQAVFLVLATKAQHLRRTDSLGPWLHAVATRVALKARSKTVRRNHIEKQVATGEALAVDDGCVWRDLRPVLDAAINRLSDKYRVPFVLCHLQGHTVAEISRRFGEPRGTVAARLARARDQLRRSLMRRGIALSATSLGLALTEEASAAAIPPLLGAATLHTAKLFAAGQAAGARLIPEQTAALMKGATRNMFLSKLGIALGVLTLLAIGTGMAGYGAVAADDIQTNRPSRKEGASTARQERAAPATTPKGPWHVARYQIFEVNRNGSETVVARPVSLMLDNQTATINIGEQIKVGEKTVFQGISCALTLKALGDGRVQIDAAVSRNDKNVYWQDGQRIAFSLSQVVTTIEAGGQLTFELAGRSDQEPSIRVRIATSTHADKPIEDIDLAPTPLPEVHLKSKMT